MADWEQKREHRNHYNNTADIYDDRYLNEQNAKIETALKHLELKNQGSIIDLGCGTGLLLPKIQRSTRQVVGLDISRTMLRKIELRKKRGANIHLILADADQTPLQQSCFDILFAVTLLQNMPNPLNTLLEMRRIIKADGVIVVTGLKKKYSERRFIKHLKSAGLKAELLETDNNIKCHIAICRKFTAA
ncbi:MAG: class I SAM-dependent methyltransferase [Candidatus Bathyarchaeota archaeon]|nr:MAG: class I SAM-dependent methyltransferase [Candidatus Bathyarchaeota archaeon]